MRLQIARAVTKQTMIMIFIGVIITVIVAIFGYSSLKINALLKQEKANAQKLYIVIEEYDVFQFNIDPLSTPRILFEAEYTNQLSLDQIFTNQHGFNHVRIENGKAQIIDADCHNRICMRSYLTNGNRLLEVATVTCQPHGLMIKWESRRNEN